MENLGKVGAYASIEKGLSARHPDRRRDQTELMPGLIIDSIKAERETDVSDPYIRSRLVSLVQNYKKCKDCSLHESPHPSSRCKKIVKFMVVSDAPTWQEERENKLFVGDVADYIKAAINEAGFAVGDGDFTTVVKAKKGREDKCFTNEQINNCRKYLEAEVGLIKPPIIIALGSVAIKHFLPGEKGGVSELAGKFFYDSKLDATIICGINPMQLVFDPSKYGILKEVFQHAADMLT